MKYANIAKFYHDLIISKRITIEDVPEEFREDVESLLNGTE